MAVTKYTYSIASDTLNAKVSDTLEIEIGSSAILTALDYIQESSDVLDIYMKDALSIGDKTLLDGVISSHVGAVLEPLNAKVDIEVEPAFASKKIMVDGVEKSIFKRVHGAHATIASMATANIDIVVSYTTAKFTGAEIFGVDLEDTLKFYVLDDATNTYSGAPGSYYQLNQFGFDVEMPPGGKYKNTSNYDADIYNGMTIRCEYSNNGASSKYISMNAWLHEVK